VAERKTKDDPRHPIGVVTARTGLSSHVLRAWERRYGVVHPARSERGERLYSDADVQHLTLLNRATSAGRSVASVASLSTSELLKTVAEDAERSRTGPALPRAYQEQAMEAVRALTPEALESTLRRAMLSLGAVPFVEEVIAPLLVEIGNEWHEGRITIAHEHAASVSILQLLGGMARALEVPGAAPRIVIATPPGELHAFGAMIAAAVAAHDGWHVTWLGSDLPVEQIAAGAGQGGARAVALSAAASCSDLARELRTLRALLPQHVPLLVGGAGVAGLSDVRGVTVVRDLQHWRALLRSHATHLGRL